MRTGQHTKPSVPRYPLQVRPRAMPTHFGLSATIAHASNTDKQNQTDADRSVCIAHAKKTLSTKSNRCRPKRLKIKVVLLILVNVCKYTINNKEGACFPLHAHVANARKWVSKFLLRFIHKDKIR